MDTKMINQKKKIEKRKENDDQTEQNSLSSYSTAIVPGTYYPRNKLHSQKSTRSETRRIVRKTGELNVERWTPNKKRFSVFSSWFVSLVETRWRWTLVFFVAAFISNWLIFGFMYWIIAVMHGDLTEEHIPPYSNDTQWTPCIKNIFGFTSTFLFSIEVHTTVAYGKRAITLECPQTIITMCLQCIVSSIFQAFLVGILFAKLSRPKFRTQTILFSKKITVSLRNDKLCLIFRVGDIRKSRILNIKASAFIMRMEINDMVVEEFDQIELKVDLDGCESIFFLWPVSVIHVIDENSPFYNISAADLLCSKIEILAVFEGLIESTGQPMQARTSYTAKDVLWGHRFVSIVTDEEDVEHFDVDFSKLSETVQVDTPLCSPCEYSMFSSSIDDFEAI